MFVIGFLDCYLWYDYFGVPQPDGSGTKPWKFLESVRSIPQYIENARWFMVLAPWCPHNDLPTICSKSTWDNRGWCRLEQGMYAMTTQEAVAEQRALYIFHDGFIQESIPLQWLFALPQEGDFVGEEDRAVVADIMAGAIMRRVGTLKEKGMLFDFRFLQAISRHTVQPPGSDVKPNRRGVLLLESESESTDAWLERFSFNGLEDKAGPEGWVHMHLAALEGNVSIARSLAARGASVNVTTDAAVAQVMAAGALTPIMVAASYIPNPEDNCTICRYLVELKADVNLKNSKGQTVLHLACTYPGGVKTAEFLLDTGSDINQVDGTGETPLHCTTLSVCTTSVSRISTAKLLLSRGADWRSIGGGLQASPWIWVACTGTAEDVTFFLEQKADPNEVIPTSEVRNTTWKDNLKLLPKENIVSQVCPHMEGCTPLMLAAWIGNWDTAEVLLKARADVALMTASGRTALDWATDSNGSGKILEMLKIPADFELTVHSI
mmetsp:Transcript_95907/g.309321  ORF Transcript_95907/g.309321 Transcript_95907/m.309321 type:complete len:493 (-) Transcript_95907:348-1826(-)